MRDILVVNERELDLLDEAVDRLRAVINFPVARQEAIYQSLHRPPAKGDPPEVIDGSKDVRESLWIQLTSSLDVIGDTSMALRGYQEDAARSSIDDLPMNYLRIYGALQAVYAQQDAIKYIALSIGMPLSLKKDHLKLYEVREIRNIVVGHPSRRDIEEHVYVEGKKTKRKVIYHAFLSRAGLTSTTFQVTKAMRGVSETRSYLLPELIHTQLVGAAAIIGALRLEFEKRFGE